MGDWSKSVRIPAGSHPDAVRGYIYGGKPTGDNPPGGSHKLACDFACNLVLSEVLGSTTHAGGVLRTADGMVSKIDPAPAGFEVDMEGSDTSIRLTVSRV